MVAQRAGYTWGTTSAYAENTVDEITFGRVQWNYLRVRGEYVAVNFLSPASTELPPRTRRIQVIDAEKRLGLGTTSAYAENTGVSAHARQLDRNYLRVRGEYATPPWGRMPPWELPPRTRRIHRVCYLSIGGSGTTSAYAENTKSTIKAPRCDLELPPRTRRIQQQTISNDFHPGTTSAYAENTNTFTVKCKSHGNYLRVRGEYPK